VLKVFIGNKHDNKMITDLTITTDASLTSITGMENFEPTLANKGQREIKVLVSGQLDQKPTI
jgi:hypothetical protein